MEPVKGVDELIVARAQRVVVGEAVRISAALAGTDPHAVEAGVAFALDLLDHDVPLNEVLDRAGRLMHCRQTHPSRRSSI